MPVLARVSDILRHCLGPASVRAIDPTVVNISSTPSTTTTCIELNANGRQQHPTIDHEPELHTATNIHNALRSCNEGSASVIPSATSSPPSLAPEASEQLTRRRRGADQDSNRTSSTSGLNTPYDYFRSSVSYSEASEACPGQVELSTLSKDTQENDNNQQQHITQLVSISSAFSNSGEVRRRGVSGAAKSEIVVQQSNSYSPPTSRTSNTKPGSSADAFDSSKVEAVVEEPLTTLAGELLAQLVQSLGLHEEKLRSFLREVERSMPPNKYHNALHVLDVTQLMYLQTTDGGPIADICADQVVKLSALLAAICHDYSHPGVSTGFLVSTGHQLVERYGKDSTLEKMHLHCLRRLCAEPDTSFMAGLESAVQERVLKYAEHVIMATDMSQHTAYVDAEPPEDPEELIIFKLKFAMKIADLSHCVRKFSIHYAFVEKLKAEFYSQGDKERELQLPISPGMDRAEDYRKMAYSQAYFLSIFILPLFTAWSKHTNGNAMVEKLRAVLQRNITSWKLLCAEPDTTGYNVTKAHSGSDPVRKLVRDAGAHDAISKSWSNMIMHEQVQAMYGLI